MSDADDALRLQLSQLDPLPATVPVDPVTSPRARQLLEDVMQTTEPTTLAAPDAARPHRRSRPLLAAAAAVALVSGGVIAAVVAGDGEDRARPAPTVLALALAPSTGGVSIGSCLPFEVRFLRDMPVALAGTVTALDTRQVTLAVDRWFTGGTADAVTIALPPGQGSAALDGVDFAVGTSYLLTATDGTVNGCGFSGPATPELQRSYEQAFTS